jgi:hypothetical protein
MLPAVFWMYDYHWWRKGPLLKQLAWGCFVFMFLLGAFMTVAGTYSTVVLIKEAYAAGSIGKCSPSGSSVEKRLLTHFRGRVLLCRQLKFVVDGNGFQLGRRDYKLLEDKLIDE